MGTNYYVTPDVCAHCGRGDERLHIGKKSSGWAFIFEQYPDRGLTSWAAWKAFVANHPVMNEYGEPVPLADLTAIVGRPNDGWTSETAPDSAYGPGSREGHEFSDAEGYRFSTSSDFC